MRITGRRPFFRQLFLTPAFFLLTLALLRISAAAFLLPAVELFAPEEAFCLLPTAAFFLPAVAFLLQAPAFLLQAAALLCLPADPFLLLAAAFLFC